MSLEIEVMPSEFLNWVKTKSGPMDYNDECACPMAEFAMEKYGFKSPDAAADFVSEWEEGRIIKSIKFVDPQDGGYFDIFEICIYHNRTYEQIADDLADELEHRG